MQPWERERVYRKKREKRTTREKVNLVTSAVALSAVCCSVIYGCVIYESIKYFIFGVKETKSNKYR